MGLVQSNKISNHELHRYAELRNRGIVGSPDEFHALHPFVRAHAGTQNAYGLTVTNGKSSEGGVIQMNDRASAWAVSSWLSGGARPAAAAPVSSAPTMKPHQVLASK